MENETKNNIASAAAAISAAVKVGGPRTQAGELISGIVALVTTQVGYTKEAADVLARRMMIDVVQLVGARRARAIVDEAEKIGAGARFS